MYEEHLKMLMELYKNPAFQKGLFDFSMKLQQEGLEAARKSWDVYPNKNSLFEKAPELFEQMLSLYSSMGFVPLKKHEEVVNENEKLKKENEFLKAAIRELQLNVFTEGGAKAQEAWSSIVEKQMEMSKDLAKNFLDIFKQKGEK